VGAEEAAAIGLVSRVVPDGEALDAALEIAGAIVGNSPFGVRMTKRVAWANVDLDLDAALALENRTQIVATMTPDSFEAKRAFVEKRTPRFGHPS
jgi:enoyl-CoA hydratase